MSSGVLMVGHSQIADCGEGAPDGTSYQNVLNYRSDPTKNGRQLRNKFSNCRTSHRATKSRAT